MTTAEVLDELRRQIEIAGSATAWGKANGFSQPFISDVLAGKRQPSRYMLNALGLERIESVTIQPRKEPNP